MHIWIRPAERRASRFHFPWAPFLTCQLPSWSPQCYPRRHQTMFLYTSTSPSSASESWLFLERSFWSCASFSLSRLSSHQPASLRQAVCKGMSQLARPRLINDERQAGVQVHKSHSAESRSAASPKPMSWQKSEVPGARQIPWAWWYWWGVHPWASWQTRLQWMADCAVWEPGWLCGRENRYQGPTTPTQPSPADRTAPAPWKPLLPRCDGVQLIIHILNLFSPDFSFNCFLTLMQGWILPFKGNVLEVFLEAGSLIETFDRSIRISALCRPQLEEPLLLHGGWDPTGVRWQNSKGGFLSDRPWVNLLLQG